MVPWIGSKSDLTIGQGHNWWFSKSCYIKDHLYQIQLEIYNLKTYEGKARLKTYRPFREDLIMMRLEWIGSQTYNGWCRHIRYNYFIRLKFLFHCLVASPVKQIIMVIAMMKHTFITRTARHACKILHYVLNWLEYYASYVSSFRI